MKESNKEDISLIQDILNNNKKAEKKLYDKYRYIIGNYIRHKYPKNFEIDDDISEIIIKIFINLEKYNQSICSFKSWVFSISKNYMIDKWRSNVEKLSSLNVTNNAIHDTNTMSCINNSSPYSSYTCSASVMKFETNSTMDFISTQISATDFSLLDMKYIQGYNYNEIGSELNQDSSVISNKVHYIKTKIKKNLQSKI